MHKLAVVTTSLLGVPFLVWGASCGTAEHVVRRYSLEGCPDTAFLPSGMIEHPPYKLKASRTPGICPAFTNYAVRDSSDEPSIPRGVGLTARFNRGPSCSLDVAYTLVIPNYTPRAEAIQEVEFSMARAVDTVATLLARAANTRARTPAAYLAHVPIRETKAWCAKPSDSLFTVIPAPQN